MIVTVDFDGTTVEHGYPAIGCELSFTIEMLRKLQSERYKLILWTVREEVLLEEALSFCCERGLEFCAMNHDHPEEKRDRNSHSSRKLKADISIDDHNLGGLPDWGTIYEMVTKELSYEDLMRKYESECEPREPRGFLSRLFRQARVIRV